MNKDHPYDEYLMVLCSKNKKRRLVILGHKNAVANLFSNIHKAKIFLTGSSFESNKCKVRECFVIHYYGEEDHVHFIARN